MSNDSSGRFKVLIAGAGVAALEAATALHQLAADHVELSLLAPDEEFVLRQGAVGAAYGGTPEKRYPLERIARDLEVRRYIDRLKWVDTIERRVHTGSGEALEYDALLLALGVRQRPRFHNALTLDSAQIQSQIQGLQRAVRTGLIKRMALIVPSQPSWPLPIYELAFLAADHAAGIGADLDITLITPEDAPLAILGDAASRRIAEALAEVGVTVLTGQHCQVHVPGRVSIHPLATDIDVDSVVALPELYGPSAPGIPTTSIRGFISIDRHGAVRDVPGVYAAGDNTDVALKQGSLAAQQADAAAMAIAAAAGAGVTPEPLQQFSYAMLICGGRTLYIRAQLAGEHGAVSEVSDEPLWDPPTKVHSEYLNQYLASIDADAVRA